MSPAPAVGGKDRSRFPGTMQQFGFGMRRKGRQKYIWIVPALFAHRSRVHPRKQLKNTALCSQRLPARRFTTCFNTGQKYSEETVQLFAPGVCIPLEVQLPLAEPLVVLTLAAVQ